MARLGRTPNHLRTANMTAHAEAILIDVSREFNIDVRSLRSDARFSHFMPPRKEYARRCVEAGIGCIVGADVIRKHHTTFIQWICQHRQAYQHEQYRRRCAQAN